MTLFIPKKSSSSSSTSNTTHYISDPCEEEKKFKKLFPDPECKNIYKNEEKEKKKECYRINNEYHFCFNVFKNNFLNFLEIEIRIDEGTFFNNFIDNLQKKLIDNDLTTNKKYTDYSNKFIDNLKKFKPKFPTKLFGLNGFMRTIFPYSTSIIFNFNYNHIKGEFDKGYSRLSFTLKNNKNNPSRLKCNEDYSLADKCIDGGFIKILMKIFKEDYKIFKKNNKDLNLKELNNQYNNFNKQFKNHTIYNKYIKAIENFENNIDEFVNRIKEIWKEKYNVLTIKDTIIYILNQFKKGNMYKLNNEILNLKTYLKRNTIVKMGQSQEIKTKNISENNNKIFRIYKPEGKYNKDDANILHELFNIIYNQIKIDINSVKLNHN